MRDHQRDVMDGEGDKRHQAEKVQTSGRLPPTEETREPWKASSQCRRHRKAREDL